MTTTSRPYTLRKQDHGDFSRRVKRLDPHGFGKAARAGCRDAPRAHVLGAALIGFGWAYCVAAIGNGRDHIEATLKQGPLSPDLQQLILSALAAVLAASMAMLAVHVVRMILLHGARRRNARALLSGAVLAFSMFHMPDSLWQTGYGLLDGRSQTLITLAGDLAEDTLGALGIDRLRLATSRGF